MTGCCLRDQAPVGRASLQSVLGSYRSDPVRALVGTTVHRNRKSSLMQLRSWSYTSGWSRLCSEGRGWLRRAADGQQTVLATTVEPARKPWRIMTADSLVD